MGRPLSKKYFGNRNVGTLSTSGDNGIGGTAVASVTLNALGSYTTRPTITFSDPDLLAVGGVRATGTITSEALSAVATAAGNGYNVGDLLVVTTAGGTATAYVATLTAGAGSGVATVNFSGTGASRGSFEALPTGAQATVSTPGAGATLTLTFRAKAVVITDQGSGYSHSTDATASFTQSVTATSVNMLVDNGILGSAGNQENAIQMTARLTGGSAGLVDIIRQVSTNRYKVTDGTRTGIVKLKSSVATAAGEGSIRLIDTDSGTYFATKLTAHKATITRGTGVQAAFPTGACVKWNMVAAAADSLKIDNT